MTAPYDLTPRAEKDLDDIALYTIQKWGAAQMEIYIRQFEERFRWLAENPDLGRRRNEVHPGYRSWSQGQHVIFYVLQANRIAIIGVPHRAMETTSAERYDAGQGESCSVGCSAREAVPPIGNALFLGVWRCLRKGAPVQEHADRAWRTIGVALAEALARATRSADGPADLGARP